MSTTFNVIPVDTDEITFAQVINVSEGHINDYLSSINLFKSVRLKINLHANNEKYTREIQLEDKFMWKDDEYIWFTIAGIAGGTDAHCKQLKSADIDPVNPWWRVGDLEQSNKTIENVKAKLEKSKELDRLWYFRRSAGQPGTIALSYGLIAASVAELTKGIIWSDDGAWDYERFPAESKDFLDWYFRPQKPNRSEDAEWAQQCIEGIKEEILAMDNKMV